MNQQHSTNYTDIDSVIQFHDVVIVRENTSKPLVHRDSETKHGACSR
jgi:hypothetical protein